MLCSRGSEAAARDLVYNITKCKAHQQVEALFCFETMLWNLVILVVWGKPITRTEFRRENSLFLMLLRQIIIISKHLHKKTSKSLSENKMQR
jgi:hypothetical protein